MDGSEESETRKTRAPDAVEHKKAFDFTGKLAPKVGAHGVGKRAKTMLGKSLIVRYS